MIIIPIVITVPDRSLMGTQRSRVRIMQCMVQRIWHLPLQIPATLLCNIGMSLDVKKYQETAEDLLIGSKLPGDFATGKSEFQLTENDSTAEKMMTAMGQGKTQVSPYQMGTDYISDC